MPICKSARDLLPDERIYLRDLLRSARYAALADSEGFHEVCYAIESLGMRLCGSKGGLAAYHSKIKQLAKLSPVLEDEDLPKSFPSLFTRFDALYETLRLARNDAMHSGSYARHAATAAVELCIGLEESLMNTSEHKKTVADYMVKSPISIESWQPVAHARQLMLMHSFSFLPYQDNGKWKLLSELAVVGFLHSLNREAKPKALSKTICDAVSGGLKLLDVEPIKISDSVTDIISKTRNEPTPTLWLVVDVGDRLVGVLSPFELM